MSEFLAEGLVVIRPDTSKFRAQLETQLAAIKIAPIAIPIVATGAGLGAVATASSALAGAQKELQSTGLGLASTEQLLNTELGRQAVILEGVTVATTEAAAAQAVLNRLDKAAVTSSLLGAAGAAGKLNAALLGLRTAVGSSAVIGLGALSLAAIAAGTAVSASLVSFAHFQTELATFRVTAGATADEMQRVADAARDLGNDVRLPAVSAADAAVAMTELSKAGLSVQDSIEGARGVLLLATAAQISNAQAAEIAANALNSFGLAGDQASRVADDLANAANAAQGSITDFGFAFQQSSAVARQVGLSLEDTTALLSLFAKNGLQGSDAGTSLRVALLRLVAPTDKAKAAIADLNKKGFQIRDAFGNVRADVFAQFGEATKNLAPSARDAAAALIFGNDAIRAVTIGAREGADGLALMQFQIDQQGTAAEIAGARTEGLAGAFSALQSTLETIGITFGGLVGGPLTEMAKGLEGLVSEVGFAIDKLRVLSEIKIPPINIDVGFKVHIPGGSGGQIISKLFGLETVGLLTPLGAATLAGKQIFDAVKGAPEAARKLKTLNDELQTLQKARTAAAEAGQIDIAKQLTPQIEALKNEIQTLNDTGSALDLNVTGPLQRAIEQAQKAKDLRLKLSVDADTSDLDRFIASVRRAIPRQPIENMIDFVAQITAIANGSAGAAAGVDKIALAMANLGRESSTLSDQLQKAQAAGASPQTQIAILQQQNVTQREIIANAERGGIQSGDPTAIRRARDKIIANNNQIESLQNEIVSDQEAAASKAKDAARKAQDARDKQFQALADLFGRRQQNIEDAIARAAIAGNVDKEKKLNEALIAAREKELKVLRARLKTLNVSVDVRRAIFDAINTAIEKAQQDSLRFAQQQKANLEAALNTRLDLKIQLAEVTGNVKAQIAAHKAKLAELRKELKALQRLHKGNTNEALQLKIDIAEEQKALKELGQQTKDRNLAFQQAAFEFLQAQQGFAANLFGNLIPSSATSGLVGNVSSQSGGDVGAGGTTFSLTGAVDGISIGAGLSSAAEAQRGRTMAGPTSGQAQSTNALLLSILHAIERLRKSADAPEAIYQRQVGSAIMDGAGGGHMDVH